MKIIDTARRRQNLQTGWWGRMHWATDRVMPPDILPDPISGEARIFVAQHTAHEYDWDIQGGPSGTREEIVLASTTLDGPTHEVAALLGAAKYHRLKWVSGGSSHTSSVYTALEQQMVIRTPENTNWHEPQTTSDIDIAHSYTFYMALLANNPGRAIPASDRMRLMH